MTVEATGKAELTITENNVLTGKGQMAVTAKVTGPGISGFGQGNGPFTVTGRREGEYLYFQFQGADIPVNGTVKAGAMSMPLDYSFSPSHIAPVDVTIERKEGATNPLKEV